MNSPQWKPFQPPVQDPAILSFQRTQNNANTPMIPPVAATNGVRETGFVEKLLHSYGFIQCCEREARLFFHFSEYNGHIETMQVGDPVEFMMSYDRRTGKPVACSVTKVVQSIVSAEIISEETYHGTIMQEAKTSRNKPGALPGNTTSDGLGRVTYEYSGECFFLPFGLDDIINNNIKLSGGDQVSFHIATDKRNGNIRACQLYPQSPPQETLQGVICSMKDTFGFIERADVVQEIFFHYSEYKGNINELVLGDDVEFNVQTRNNKDVAVNIQSLTPGTVIFEDISVTKTKGILMKPLRTNSRRQSDPLPGRVSYETPQGTQDISYGDKDQDGDYTLMSGDIVEFKIATDRRDKLQHATDITLLADELFKSNKTTEKREMGIVQSLKEGFGFIQLAQRDSRVFFHFSELLNGKPAKLQDNVEFTLTTDPNTPSRQIAIRVREMPKNNFTSAPTTNIQKFIGTVDREPAMHKSPSKNKDFESGNIVYDFEGAIKGAAYHLRDVMELKNPPKYGDKVEFQSSDPQSNNTKAVNVRVVLRSIAAKYQGFIATLKENYGFIENAEHNKEVFFHFSSYTGDLSELDLGDEVEYVLTRKSDKVSAENIRKLPRGVVAPEEIVRELGNPLGRIIRPMRIVNPDQDEYAGLVRVGGEAGECGDSQDYTYGITSLADKRDFLQKGDVVRFQVACVKSSSELRAVNIAAIRKYIRAYVDSVKGQYGFINYEVEEGKKLFFHMTEVHDGIELKPGDEVEFVVVQNQRNGKYSACSLRKITERQRPERLLSRIRSVSEDVGPRVVVIRQPKGPENSRGFKQPRKPWKPLG